MADRQLLAKCGVVVLLGLNVGAYYLFWPKNNGCPTKQTERTPQSAPATPIPAAPQNFAPLNDSSGPVKNDKAMEADAAVSRLLDLIKKDSVQPIPVVGERYDVPIPDEKPGVPPPVVPGPNPRTLPPLKAEPISDQADHDPDGAITSILTQKNQAGPWLVAVKKSGTQSLVTAKLRGTLPSRSPVEFEILCDRVDASGADGLKAIGHVTFIGAGIRGRSQRLTIPWSSPNLVFAEQVRITPDNTGGSSLPSTQLCGERFVWEQPANSIDVNAVEFRPAGVLGPNAPTPSVLGTPK